MKFLIIQVSYDVEGVLFHVAVLINTGLSQVFMLKCHSTKVKFYLLAYFVKFFPVYRHDRKFSDRQVWANSVDPEQAAPLVWSGSTLFAILSASFARSITLP